MTELALERRSFTKWSHRSAQRRGAPLAATRLPVLSPRPSRGAALSAHGWAGRGWGCTWPREQSMTVMRRHSGQGIVSLMRCTSSENEEPRSVVICREEKTRAQVARGQTRTAPQSQAWRLASRPQSPHLGNGVTTLTCASQGRV